MNTAIAIHLACSLMALPLGAWMLAAPKGTPRHRLWGRLWVALIVGVCLSSFWIRDEDGYGVIHLLTLWTLISVAMAVACIRRRRVAAHRGWMIGTMAGLVTAGILTLGPQRLLGGLLFGW